MDTGGMAHPALTALFTGRNDERLVRHRQRLHRAGDSPDYVYLVTRGWFGRFRSGREGAEAVTGIYMLGDIIGLDAVHGEQLPDELVALSDGTVLRLPCQDALTGIERGGALALEAARLLANESCFLREALFAVGTQSSRSRLSMFLIQTYQRLIAAHIVGPDAVRFDLPLTQAQFGAVAGITPVHVNRVLRALRTDGPFSVKGGTVHITDMTRLRLDAKALARTG